MTVLQERLMMEKRVIILSFTVAKIIVKQYVRKVNNSEIALILSCNSLLGRKSYMAIWYIFTYPCYICYVLCVYSFLSKRVLFHKTYCLTAHYLSQLKWLLLSSIFLDRCKLVRIQSFNLPTYHPHLLCTQFPGNDFGYLAICPLSLHSFIFP